MIVINVVLMLSLVTPYILGAEMQEDPKTRRAGSMTMYPFPRVGRSQIGRSWLITPENYAELHNEIKRAGLIPFPRVGRAMYEQHGARRYNGDGPSGMWFGPRLGRFSKKSIDRFDDRDPWAMFAFKDINASPDFTPHLGREQEDQPEEDQIDLIEQPEQDTVRQARETQ